MNWMGWQLDYLLLLQDFRHLTNGFFDNFFLLVSQIGVAPFTIVLLCAIYWGINKELGRYMLYCTCFSLLINTFLKLTFCIYRPWILDSRIQPTDAALKTAPGYSFPSGHTAGATSFWGSIAMYFKNKKWVVFSCFTIIFLVMLSRNYLGVHTSQDVIVSFFVGIGILFFVNRMFNWMKEKEGRDNIVTVIISVVCVLLIAYLALKSYPADYQNGIIIYDSTNAKLSGYSTIINVFALLSGSFLEMKFIRFNPAQGSIAAKIISVLIGLTLFFIIKIFIYDLLCKAIDVQIAKYITCFLTGLFITLIYPCFIKLSTKGKD